MQTKQIRFRCTDDSNYSGGILVDTGEDTYIICGCCGGIIDWEDVEDFELYDHWVNISNEIIGD